MMSLSFDTPHDRDVFPSAYTKQYTACLSLLRIEIYFKAVDKLRRVA
jgi:hypothetical protein